MAKTASWFLLPIALAVVLAGLLGDEWQLQLRYQSDLFSTGQLWRLVSGHLLHLGWNHLLMNLAGLILIVLIFNDRPLSRWWFDSLICALGVSLGLYLFSPETYWYVGLSGLLHGLLIAAIVDYLPQQPRIYGLLLTTLAGKLLWEQILGPLPLSESTIQGIIIVNAHLYGAICGLGISLLIDFRER
ncbi:MAG: rhombosortase [Candidatus Polarisedimenticolaceae bacterium]|nr:rhombosortase [Candidatus Polarisedimenticolaceae bacterium]